ncbi:INO80 complex subunit D-B [Scleropages formosus]|uniref:INO80 complex subunit D n=1 Tax=Scleropages formosus TaxID=113540 RepID=A0A8C9UZF7_SCLFO|nr:INO80 complex subunit D [Scleropages formosus]XP_018580454.1 INO80 complex subunit D [Scleropages formosus]XP_018580465.1 INO80 complex subunit D [Scleropages formosus]XP_018580472.1 INO80 complex subunit D [Scleropages formosus]
MYEGKHIHFSEVDNKPLCSYSPKLCKQRRLNGYAFCIRHVLEDRTAPFKQCEYVAKYNSQRCTNPIPKSEDRRYCNSHLQVLGFIPKKERKKKHDVLDEMRARSHLESVALNIMVPPLALKTPNGLDELPPSPTHPRVLPPPEVELLDPFAFHEDEMDGEEGTLRKASAVKKKLQNRLALNQRLRLGDADLLKPLPEHFNPSPLPSQRPSSPLRSALPTQQPGLVPQLPHPFLIAPGLPVMPQGLLCKPAPPQNNAPPPPGPPLSAISSPAHPSGPTPSRKVPPMATPLSSGSQESPQRCVVIMHPAAFSPPSTCRVRLRRLVQLCSQRHQQHGDLFPHLGLDWSEDSADDDDDDETESIPSYPYAWRLHERHQLDNSDEDADCPRSTRLLRLCTYLRQKYKHLCRQERAAMRQKKYRYAFRKALLHAASKDPDCAGHLMQELRMASTMSPSAKSPVPKNTESGRCTGSSNGQACISRALPYTGYCFQHILLNRSQQLFSSCTAKFADGQQCSIPVFDITHQTPLCEEHAKKMDNFLRGDSNRRVQQQQHQLQQQQRKPRRKTKPPALTKKHKKKRRRGPRRPQKPIPPAVPQGNLAMPSSLVLPTASASIRSPSTPDLSTDELPDDITNDISDIPNDLELNQEDFSDVLPRLPDDLQDFDLFEGKNGDLLPTTEEAEELVRALQAMGSYPDTLACLGTMGELPQPDGVDHRSMAVFSGPGVQSGAMGDLLNGRIPTENFSGLDLDDNLLHSTGGPFPPPPPAPSGTNLTSVTPPSSSTLLAQSALTERTFRPHPLAKVETAHSSPHSSHYGSEHVPSPYSDHISSPHPSSFQTEPQMLLEVPLSGVPCPPRSPWNSLPLSLTDPAQFGNLIGPEGHLMSTSLSTPPSTTHSVTIQPTVVLSALPPSALTGLTAPAPTSSSSSSAASSSSQHDLLTSTQPKLQLPQFSAAFGHQLTSHSGIPKDVQPSHSSTAPPTGFSIASATAASANNAVPPFTTQ